MYDWIALMNDKNSHSQTSCSDQQSNNASLKQVTKEQTQNEQTQNEQTLNEQVSGQAALPDKLPDKYHVGYEELIHRFEKCEQDSVQWSRDESLSKDEKLSQHEKFLVVKAILNGAKELILRQDETKQDFRIAIVVLLEQVDAHL